MAHHNGGSSALPNIRRRRSLANLGAFVFGLPLGVGVLALLLNGPFHDTDAERYVHHPVEQVEVMLFCCAFGGLLAKGLGQMKERAAFRRGVLPVWDGRPGPVEEADTLLQELAPRWGLLQNTYLARRVAAILDFVYSRGSAHELDDQMRALSDNDAIALESSYSLIRLIIWAIPILGFLGTVLGITGAISGVTPEVLENSISGVTNGLSVAFDATALALGLTMLLMFLNYLVDRLEQRTLERVDQYVDENLAHRFERTGPDTNGMGQAFRQNVQLMVKATEQLVEKQAAVWAKSLQTAEKHWNEASQREQDRLRGALETALDRTLASHQQRLLELEKQALERSRALHEGLTALATVLRDTGREHQAALAQVMERLTIQGEALARLHEDEGQLNRLQDSLQRNLSALASAGTFEQAIESLTGAVHLLTARAGNVSRLENWQGKAA